MRDIKRIDVVTAHLEELWKLYPDLRFGQLITLVCDELYKLYGCTDTFLPEDDRWDSAITSLINRTNHK